MKKIMIRAIAAVLCVVMMVGLVPFDFVSTFLSCAQIKASAADWGSSVVNGRDDGKWLFPLDESLYWFSDWAGCNQANGCKCPFGHSSKSCHITCNIKSHNNHNGVDIPATNKTVSAAASGTAFYSDSALKGRGNTLVIEHPIDNKYSYYSYYQHLSIVIKKSGSVDAGDPVAITGDTGSPGQYHLHFGIVIGEKGRGSEVANGTYLSTLEGKGWITSPGLREGRIVTNPSLKSKKPGGFDSVKQHAGSVTYVFNKSEVTVGGKIDPPPYSKLCLTDNRVPSGSLPYGKSYGIYGGVRSEYYNITRVRTSIKNSKNQNVITPIDENNINNTFYSFRGRVNNEIIFNNTNVFKEDYYTFIVEVWDTKDYKTNPKQFKYEFTIGNPKAPKTHVEPTLFSKIVSVLKGVLTYLTVPTGTEVYYTTDGSDPVSSKTKVKYIENSPIMFASSSTIRAVAVKNGVSSVETQRTITVEKVAQPTISSYLTSTDMCITINCATPGAILYYTLDGTNPSVDSNGKLVGSTRCYNDSGLIHLQRSATVKAYAAKSGCSNSAVSTATITVKVPAAPGLEIPTSSDIAVGDPIELRWNARNDATSYKVRVYRNRQLIDTISVPGSRYAYIPSVAGSYTFGVDAVNFVGQASSDSTKTVTAHDPVTVRFVDDDGQTLIEEKSVRYGYSASAPAPKKKGWVFRAWDSTGYFHATTDMTIKAQFDREKYVIRFIDDDGKTLYSPQEVEYEGQVTLPPNPSNGITGYKFMDWRVLSADNSSVLDYNYVDANLTLQAVYEWANPDLPIAIQQNSANAVKTKKVAGDEHTVYTVSAKLNNFTGKSTFCRVLITLKTSSGKALLTAVRDFHLEKGAVGVTFNSGEIICDKVVSKIELNVVGIDENGDKTTSAYSDSYTINSIDDEAGIYFTDWSPNRTYASNAEERKTMYRYHDKRYTTSTSNPLSGWNHYDTSVSYGGWSGNQYTTSYPGSSDTLQVIGQSTTYNYYHYCSKYDGKWNVDSVYVNSTSKYHSFSTTNALPSYTINADKGGKRTSCYGYKGCTNQHACDYNFYTWWLSGSTTTYTYQTRSKTTTYYYWQWGNWSNWSETPAYTGGDREAQTTTYYRYKITPKTSTEGEDNSGTRYDLNSGNIRFRGTPGVIPSVEDGVQLVGRKANVIVYKASLNDPTANHIEYVGQITIGEGNTYDISFIPAQEPDEAESNYTIALAIEGQTSLYNIGTILCSKSKHQVDFYYYNAEGEYICESQTVEEGDNAVVPTPPVVPGKVFVGWNNDTTNVIASRKIEALYADKTYSVVFVNFETDFVSMQQYKYGEVIGIPAAEDFDGKLFLGWEGLDADNPIATDNAVYVAKYQIGTFTVKFEDGFGNVISTQTVESGNAAELPNAPEHENLIFRGWSQDQMWWNVKNDMTVTPIWVYENTVVPPNVEVENLYFGGAISAQSEEEGATIYYAVDDGRGAPPLTLSQQESEGFETPTDEQEILPNSVQEHIVLNSDDEGVEEYEDYADEEFDFYGWCVYNDDMIFDEDATIYFYAVADGMNDSEIVTFNYKYVPVMYPYEDHTGETNTVTFLDDDGFVLDEQVVNYFEDAVAPEVEEREGFIFIGWDNKFDHVTEDLEVTAQYVPEDEYVTFALDQENVTLTAGETCLLNVNAVNVPEDSNDIIWTSSNDAVAEVSLDGVVLTHQAGEAVITVKTYDGSYKASCKVTVLPDVNNTVMLRNNSELLLNNGMLMQIPITSSHQAATVAAIKAQIASPNVKLVDANGNELPDSSIVTTNTQIRIVIDGVVTDAVVVIVFGDYDRNGVVNNRDAARIMRYLVNKETPDQYQLHAIDVNKDGFVNNRDAAMISRYLVGKEVI